jgi:biopolymer transport protein ExbD
MAFSTNRKADINVTPMIDVLLVLLIIFMTIDFRTTGLDAKVPQPAPADSANQPTTDIVVTVRSDDTVRLNQEPVALADLQSRLVTLYKNRPTRVLFVRAEGDPPFEQVARVIDLARGAGLERVALMPH